ncbi:hypothetical protein DBV15_03252 [Temnothorax longispinosus]|uniref:Uncharacterized protein n=1 Tax=Temnothorax longispinosus TaxID=300112 RepID=A0A4S2JM67_9HYME|nr:hypothetical protein DBV15_03252 [Temnothorax longispinosus]
MLLEQSQVFLKEFNKDFNKKLPKEFIFGTVHKSSTGDKRTGDPLRRESPSTGAPIGELVDAATSMSASGGWSIACW